MKPAAGFGPWVADLPELERIARLRELRALAVMYCGPAHPLAIALREAEADPEASERALEHLERLPPLRRRRVLATLAELRAPAH
ncbi:MAG TPA: hypothetical protein VKZ79_02165 [Alphaproteobacteria bacterium]|nr:hypothetical protein [Alphaproteobacteria bacterium]